MDVAPFMGAWIEIGAVMILGGKIIVAPFMGAWIEILYLYSILARTYMSHPSWVRGLKYGKYAAGLANGLVAPFMGAWIEIEVLKAGTSLSQSRTLHGCVD